MTLKTRIADVRALDEKRTPGEWIVLKIPNLDGSTQGLTIAGDNQAIARIKNTESKKPLTPEDEANAYLILSIPTMLTIINELTDKLAKVRHLINEAGEMASQDGAVAVMLVLNEALKLTDIEQEQE